MTCVCVVIEVPRDICAEGPCFYDTAISSILLWRTGDIVKKIPITLYHRLFPGEHDEVCQKKNKISLVEEVINQQSAAKSTSSTK